MFVSSLLNPEAQTSDLIMNGITAENTGFLTPDVYKNSDFVKQRFTDANGNFDQSAFEQAYNNAAKKYDELASVQTMDDLNQIISQYNPNDIYASEFGGNTYKPTYEVQKVLNPIRVSEGVTHLFEKGENTKSMRELAQMSKIWDTEKQQWLDQTAEDRGFFGGLFGTPLVYATWDEDGEHFDKTLGRTVHHRKGDWKTNDSGQYYTETIGDRQGYDKQFVAFSDTLTKEDSWLNKVDFFDSDGLYKSPVGTTFKMVATIFPYLIPEFNVFWGGAVAATQLASVMPTFAKMLEGIAVGDKETGFTKKMNLLENYWKRYDDSYSDDAQNSQWGYQKMATLIGDIFGQLYQMRAMSSLSFLKQNSIAKANEKAFVNFAQKFGAEYAAAAEAGTVEKGFEGMAKFWHSIAQDMPEIKAAIESQSRLSKNLSLGYMALTSSADVYSDAIQSGYDRRMAGLAGVIATAGQYAIMMNNRMGDWFLDATTGYKENISRNALKQALRPYYDLIGEGVDKIGKEVTTEGKMKVLSNIYNTVYNKGIKNFWNIIKDGGEEFWKRSIIEGVEEMTEEAVMDMTKGAFDFMSWLGIGKNSDTASFGGFENVFSMSGLERYLMNAVGGAVGGALFTFQQNIGEPSIRKAIGQKIDPETKASLIHAIASGHTDEIMTAIDSMCKTDNKVLAMPVTVGGQKSNVTGDTSATTRGEVVASYLKNYVKSLEAIVQDNGMDLTDAQLFQKVIRDRALLPMIEDSEVHKMILTDFNQAAVDLAKLEEDLAAEVNVNTKDDEKKDGKDKTKPEESEKVKNLKKQIAEKKKWIQEFLNGEHDEKYLQVSLAYLNPAIRQSLLNMDKYSYTQSKYGVSYNSLPTSGAGTTQADVDKEYSEWKEQEQPEQKFVKIAVPAFNNLEQILSPVIKEYIDKYAGIRANTLKNILSPINAMIGGKVSEPAWKAILARLSSRLSEEHKTGATLQDIFQVDDDFIKSFAESIIGNHDAYFAAAAQALQISPEEAKQLFIEELAGRLEQYPVANLNKPLIDEMLFLASKGLSSAIVQSMKGEENIPLTKESVNAKLQELGLPIIGDDVLLDSEQTLADAFGMLASPKANVDAEFGLETTVVMKYLAEQDTLDAEIVRTIKMALYQQILSKHKAIEDAVLDYTIFDSKEIDGEIIDKTGVLSLTKDDFTLLDQKVYAGLNDNLPIEKIIEDWLLNPQDGVITVQHKDDAELANLLEIESDAATKIKDIVMEQIQNSTVEAYEKQASKLSVENPLFKLFRTMGFEVSKAGETNLMELLEMESSHLSQLSSVDEYLRQGVTAEQIENFEKLLDMMQAVVIGMEDAPISLGNPISYNVQLKRYKEKWHNGEGAEKYQLIASEHVRLLVSEIALLRNKLQFLKGLIDSNTESKLMENAQTKTNFQQLLVKFILQKGADLRINGISIFPPRDEIQKQSTDEQKLGFIEHAAYENFQKAVAKSNVQDAVSQLIAGFGFNGDAIIQSALKSNGLNSKTQDISEADLFVYIATIVGADQHEFLGRYKKMMSEENYNKVPFYAQEYAMKTGYSFYADKLGIHAELVKQLFKDRKNLALDETSHFFFLNGISGAGKTSVVQAGIYYMLGPNDRVWIAAPNMNQANKLADSLQSIQTRAAQSVLDKKHLFESFLKVEIIQQLADSAVKPNVATSLIKTVEVENTKSKKFQCTPEESWLRDDIDENAIPQVIFIDEITHFNKAELQTLEFIADKYNIKIFTSGDTLQRGSKIGSITHNIETIFSWRPPRLLISVRASNIENKDNTDQAKQRLIAMEDLLNEQGLTDNTKQELNRIVRSSIFEVKYYEDDNELHGTKMVETLVEKDLQRLLNAVKQANANLKEGETPKKIGILADLKKDADGNWVLKDDAFRRQLEDLGLQEGQYTFYYSPDDFNERAVQGSEEEYFIIKDVNIDASSDDRWDQLVSFYTYITRSMSGGLLVMPDSITRSLNIINKQMPHTDSYAMPGLDQQTGLKTTRIADIDKIIGENYAITEEAKRETHVETPTTPTAVSDSPAPSIEEKPIIPLAEDAQKEVDKTIEQGEAAQVADSVNGEQTLQQEAIGTTKHFDTVDQGIWGYGFYEHQNIVKVERKSESGTVIGSEYRATKEGTSIDFDGLIPDTEYITYPIRRGFSKFQKILALYQDTKSAEFKAAMQDPDIMDFFYEVCPELSEHHGEDDIDDRRQDIYQHLVEDGWLSIDEHDYIFGKYYDPTYDRSYHVGSSAEQSLNKGDLFLTFGKRIQVKNQAGQVKINQYITSGVFSSDSNAMAHIQNCPAYNAVKKQITDDLAVPGVKLAVLQLQPKKRIKPLSGLNLYKLDDHVETLYDLRNKGMIFNLRELAIVDSRINDATGNYKFLEFMARYEAGSDEAQYKKKLKEFNRPTTEGGFIRIDPVTGVHSLAISGKYFIPVGFTRAADRRMQRILILEPQQIDFRAAVEEVQAIVSNAGDDSNRAIIPLRKMRKLSSYSQTRLVISALKHIGVLDENGKDQIVTLADGTKGSAVKLYLERTVEQMKKITGWVNPDIDIIVRAIENNDTFDEATLKAALNQTKSFGIFFIDANIRRASEADGGGLYMYDLVDPTEGSKPRITLDFSAQDDFGYRNFLVDSTTKIDGEDFYTSSLFQSEKVNMYLQEIGLVGYQLQLPTYALVQDTLSEFKSVSSTTLTHVAIDRNAAKKAKEIEDLTGKSWGELSKLFTGKVKLQDPHIIYDASEPTTKTGNGTKNTTPHLENKWGYDVKKGDTVQLFNDEGDIYTVAKVYPETNKILLADKNGEKITSRIRTTSVDNVTRVVTRRCHSWVDFRDYDYYGKGTEKHKRNWKKHAEQVQKETKEKISKAQPKLEDKQINAEDFEISSLGQDKNFYVIIPFNGTEDYGNISMLSKSTMQVVAETNSETFKEAFEDAIYKMDDKINAGALVLHFTYSKYKPLDPGVQYLKDVIEKMKSKPESLIGYTEKVLLFQSYKRPTSTEKTYPLPVGALAQIMANGDGKPVANEATAPILIADSQEILKNRGFKFGRNAEFIAVPIAGDKFMAVPKYTLFQKNGVPIPNVDPEHPRLDLSSGPIVIHALTEQFNSTANSPVTIKEIITNSDGTKSYSGIDSVGQAVTWAVDRVDYGLHWLFLTQEDYNALHNKAKSDMSAADDAPVVVVEEEQPKGKPKEDNTLTDKEKLVQEAQNTPFWKKLQIYCTGGTLTVEQIQALKTFAEDAEIPIASYDFITLCRLANGVLSHGGKLPNILPNLNALLDNIDGLDKNSPEFIANEIEAYKYAALLHAISFYNNDPFDAPEDAYSCNTEKDEVWQVCLPGGKLPF